MEKYISRCMVQNYYILNGDKLNRKIWQCISKISSNVALLGFYLFIGFKVMLQII